MRRTLAAALTFVTLSACASHQVQSLSGTAQVHLDKNGSMLITVPQDGIYGTHKYPGSGQRLLYTANYQSGGLIVRCSEIAMGQRSSKELAFTDVPTGVHYLYRFSPKQTPEGLDANIAKYFGPICDPTAVKSMSAADQQGMIAGKAMVGMTKQAVIYAIGYPPQSDTPSTTSDRWLYWHSKSTTFIVLFTNGVVSSVQ